jgi:DNA-binding GntR family transcriptional regulator
LVQGGGLAISNSEHREMVDAIAAKDGDRAHRAHFDHVMRARERLTQTEEFQIDTKTKKVSR